MNYQCGYKQRDICCFGPENIWAGCGNISLEICILTTCLFQHPLVAYEADGHRFQKERMGKNTLANSMQRISSEAGLSIRYACHCVSAPIIAYYITLASIHQAFDLSANTKRTTGLLHTLTYHSNFECPYALTKAFPNQPVGSPVARTSKNTEGWHLHSGIVDVCERDVQSAQYAQYVSVIQTSPGSTVTLSVSAVNPLSSCSAATGSCNNAQRACYIEQQQSVLHAKCRHLIIWPQCNVK